MHLGTPVVPEEYRMKAGCAKGTCSNSSGRSSPVARNSANVNLAKHDTIRQRESSRPYCLRIRETLLVSLRASLHAWKENDAFEAVCLKALRDLPHCRRDANGLPIIHYLGFRENELRLYLFVSFQETLQAIITTGRMIVGVAVT